MIELPPTVEQQDGEEIVVDQDGYELVLRPERTTSGSNLYHRPDPDAAERGEQRARCRYGRMAHRRNDTTLLWRRRDVLDATWSACPHCESDDPDTVKGDGGAGTTQLCSLLANDDDTKAKLEAALDEGGSA